MLHFFPAEDEPGKIVKTLVDAFKGLSLVPPGVVVVSEWRPEPGAIPLPAAQVAVNGGVARKP